MGGDVLAPTPCRYMNIVKDHVHKVMGTPEEEQCFFDTWGEEKLSEILRTQKANVEHQKRQKD